MCIGRADGQSLSEVVTVTCNLPFIAAGCDTLRVMVDEASAIIEDWSSSACEALLQDQTVHAMTLKHVLASLPELVSHHVI